MADMNRLKKIKEINFTEKDDAELEAYLTELYFFCDTLPSHKESIRATLEAKDYDTFLVFLENLREFLLNIQAEGLAESCQRHADEVKATIEQSGEDEVDREMLEAEIDVLLATLDTLSIDILVAGLIGEHQPEPPPAPPEPASDAEADAKPKDDTISVLAVDDSEFFLNILKLYFRETPYELECVTSGETAVRYLAEPGRKPPNLFLLFTERTRSHAGQVMSGYELAKTIRKVGLYAPILFITDNASRGTVIEALQSGGSDLIVKASSKEQILERIKKHIH